MFKIFSSNSHKDAHTGESKSTVSDLDLTGESKSTVSELDLFLVLHLSSINKMFQDIFFLKTSHIDKYIAVKER